MLGLVPEAPMTMPSSEIARRLFGQGPTGAQLRGLRRAIQSLAGKGLVVTKLEEGPVWVRDVTATARPGGGGYRKVDHGGYRLGHAVMHHVSRPVSPPSP